MAFAVGILALTGHAFAFGTPIATDGILSFENVTPISLTLQLNPSTDAIYSSLVTNRQSISVEYRPYGCTDSATSQICTMQYAIPSYLTFSYNADGSIAPLSITGLQPATQYLFFLGHGGTATSATYDPAAFTVTTPSSAQYVGETALTFSGVTNDHATVTVVPGSDVFQREIAGKSIVLLRYTETLATNYQTQAFTYSTDGSQLLPLTISNLLPNVQYQTWIGYLSPSSAPVWSDQSFTFTTLPTATGTNASSPVSASVITQRLTLGSRSSQVLILETYLAEHGFMSKTYVDTYFGTTTVVAIKSFQRTHGLTVDGRVGPMTRNAINLALAQQ